MKYRITFSDQETTEIYVKGDNKAPYIILAQGRQAMKGKSSRVVKVEAIVPAKKNIGDYSPG